MPVQLSGYEENDSSKAIALKEITITNDASNNKSRLDVLLPTTQKIRIFDGVVSGQLRLDGSTEAMEIIDYEHHEIHSGSSFVLTNVSDVASGATFDLLMVTPDTTSWAHMFIQATTERETLFEIFEGVTTSSDGTVCTPTNRNRNSTSTANLLCYHTPSITSTASLILNAKSGSGKTGGEARSEQEIVLKQNTKYLFRVTNDSASAGWVSQQLNWYEHTDKN
jgi:hypothetical protein